MFTKAKQGTKKYVSLYPRLFHSVPCSCLQCKIYDRRRAFCQTHRIQAEAAGSESCRQIVSLEVTRWVKRYHSKFIIADIWFFRTILGMPFICWHVTAWHGIWMKNTIRPASFYMAIVALFVYLRAPNYCTVVLLDSFNGCLPVVFLWEKIQFLMRKNCL